MLVDAWTARSLAEGAPPWRRLDRPRRPRRPPCRRGSTWSGSPGALGRAGRHRAGSRSSSTSTRCPAWSACAVLSTAGADLSADAVDLARRVGQVLGVLAVHRRARPCCARHLAARDWSTLPAEPLVAARPAPRLGRGARPDGCARAVARWLRCPRSIRTACCPSTAPAPPSPRTPGSWRSPCACCWRSK